MYSILLMDDFLNIAVFWQMKSYLSEEKKVVPLQMEEMVSFFLQD